MVGESNDRGDIAVSEAHLGEVGDSASGCFCGFAGCVVCFGSFAAGSVEFISGAVHGNCDRNVF